MDTKPLCPSCGKPLEANAPKGLCPECLMKGAFPTGTDTGGKSPRFVPPRVEDLAAKFPQLEILEFIGQGGMGAVYKTRQKQLNRLVALKILPPGVGGDRAFAERFTREARALAQLNHPGIVTLYEFGQTDGLFYFLMEFVDGVNLRQLLHASRLAPKEALAIVPQICDALQYAHERGIVHRDIKPENILMNREGQVKIADFGVAKIVAQELDEAAAETNAPAQAGELTKSGSTLGTPQYMAPEQIKNSAEVDHRADIYSLGVVFYQMLTGELPSGKIEPPSRKVQIDVRLDEVVLRALEREPERRYQHASEVRTQVETIATTAQPSPRETPPGFKHYKNSHWHFELDIPEGWNTFPPVHTKSPYELMRFASHENGNHLLIVFRKPHNPTKSLKDFSDWAQKCVTKVGFRNFVSAETTIGGKLARTLDFDRRGDEGTWSRREFFLVEGTLGYVLGFGTSNKTAMFETFDRIAKSFRFRPSSEGNEFSPFIPKTKNWRALIKIPFAVLREWKPKTNWPAVILTGLIIALLMAGGMIAAKLIGIRDAFNPRTLCMVVLPAVLLIPLWLAFEVRAAHHTLAAGKQPLPLFSKRKSRLHRVVSILLTAFVIAFFVRTFLVAPYRVENNGVAPEIPRGSDFLVWRPVWTFAPDDIVAFWHHGAAWVGRVINSADGVITVGKNGHAPMRVRRADILGKVITIYWRGSEVTGSTPKRFRTTSSASSLQFRLVLLDNSTSPAEWLPSASGSTRFHVSRQVLLDGSAVAQVGVSFSPGGQRKVEIRFTDAGAEKFKDITATNTGRQLAIIFDGQVLSAPVIQSAIPGGGCQIDGPRNNDQIYDEIVNSLNPTGFPESWQFSRVRERILPFQLTPNALFGWLDLNSGIVLTNSTLDWTTRTGHEWIQKHDLDVVTTESAKHLPVLLGIDMIIAPAPTNGWEIVNPTDVADNWALSQDEPRQDQVFGAMPGKSDTYFFQNREGKRGLLQILGFTGNPHGVKVRYKLVQSQK